MSPRMRQATEDYLFQLIRLSGGNVILSGITDLHIQPAGCNQAMVFPAMGHLLPRLCEHADKLRDELAAMGVD